MEPRLASTELAVSPQPPTDVIHLSQMITQPSSLFGFVLFLRDGLTLSPRLASNYSIHLPQPPGAEITDVSHHAQLQRTFLEGTLSSQQLQYRH